MPNIANGAVRREPRRPRGGLWRLAVPGLLGLVLAVQAGCRSTANVVPPEGRAPLDRSIVEAPAGFALIPVVHGLTAPTSIAVDNTDGPRRGTILIAEGGAGGGPVRIWAYRPPHGEAGERGSTTDTSHGSTGTLELIFPRGRQFPLAFLRRGFQMHGPIGGMVVVNGKIIVSHRDGDEMGVITALDYDGTHSTIVADLPAQGDYGVTDIAVNPVNGRIYFGVGAATNSGVVGIDNWAIGWVNDHPKFCDSTLGMLKLLGYRFDTNNPKAGLIGGPERAVTAPMQPFNSSNQTRIAPAINGKPTSAIYSCSPTGGDLRVEAHGIRLPRGLAFDSFGQLYFTNNGMEMRGTRPVKDDPDALLKLTQNWWYGFPDFSTDLFAISDSRFQPPLDLIIRYGYPELSFLIDHRASKLESPEPFRSQLLFGVFPSQSGAAKIAFVPDAGPAVGPFREFRGLAVVALSGDRAPFATSGRKLVGPIGHRVVAVDVDPSSRQVRDFVRNTSGMPASAGGRGSDGLERPVDVKFGPDGSLYVLDFGQMTVENGKEKIGGGTGRLFRLVPIEWLSPEQRPSASTQPTTP